MRFDYRYYGSSAVDSSPAATGLSFAPDTTRSPTFFEGTVAQALPFRECMSALHDVVASDLRFKPKDRSQYFAWLETQQLLDVAGVAAERTQRAAELSEVRAELATLDAERRTRMGPYYKAQRRYFDYLYQRDYDAWFVLDPVITVHPDALFFECFSQDESSYGRVTCRYEVFEQLGERAEGTTNVDYSAGLYDAFQKIRDYKTTTLKVDPSGFDVKTAEEPAYREVKIDLPDSWMRGFLQVSSAMTMPATVVNLLPAHIRNLLFVLKRRRERFGPRSLRFELKPGAPVVVVVEPWGTRLELAGSYYEGDTEQEIRVWGRRRLALLERLLPVARSFRLSFLGYGMPWFVVADCGDLSFTLGLSGWTAADWSKQGNFDLLMPRGEVDGGTLSRVFDGLGADWLATPRALAARLALDEATVEAALGAWCQVGRVMYDLERGVYRKRELTREPLDMERLRFSSERERLAAEILREGQAMVAEVRVDPDGRTHVKGTVGRGDSALVLDSDRRLVDGACHCSFFFRNRLRRGPCEHLLALRLAHERRVDRPGGVDIRPGGAR